MKLMADLDPILYPAAALAVVYLLVMGFIHWKRNNPDKWQRVLGSTGLSTPKR